MLKILRAGIYTTVQDLGRNGFRSLGISQGGALDAPALKIANLLVGNRADSAGLEITLGQFSVEFTRPGWIALTGAGCDALLDGKPLWTGWRYPVKAGQQLVLQKPKHGMNSFFVKFIFWGILTALAYHICGGVRHLLMDFGYIEESLAAGQRSAQVAFVLTVVLSILAGVLVW